MKSPESDIELLKDLARYIQNELHWTPETRDLSTRIDLYLARKAQDELQLRQSLGVITSTVRAGEHSSR